MKKIITLVITILNTVFVFAQAPQKLSYQTVIRNSSNILVSNTPVNMQISILEGSVNGKAVYTELHNPKTNAIGLVTIEIGDGSSPSGKFSSINWGSNTYFLKTEIDPLNGNNYSIVGTSQLLNVHHNEVEVKVSPIGDTLAIGNSKRIIIPGISNANNTPVSGYVKDVSGNSYPTIIIGNQEWMAENLRTTKYNDGSRIPIVTDNTQWAKNWNDGVPLKLPMMCWFNNEQSVHNANKLGALYNWYAINPSTNGNKNVCPTGWHIPSEAEWDQLVKHLDPGADLICSLCSQSTTAGGMMKSTGTQFWLTPNEGANNSTGFSALPAGKRYNHGGFFNIGGGGYWWCSTENDTIAAWYRGLYFDDATPGRFYDSKASGFSVRCLKD